MTIKDTAEQCTIVFDSVIDIKRYLIAKGDKGFYESFNGSFNGSHNFTGTKSWDEFMDIIDNGSDDILAMVKSNSKAVSNELIKTYSLTNDYKLDVTGLFFDVGLVLSGEPEAWLSPIEEEVKEQVEININASFLGEVNKEDVIKNASRIIGMVLALETIGVSSKINLNFRSDWIYNSNLQKIFKVSLVAKEYDQGVDYRKLSALLHPSMFRRGVFRMREVEVWKDMKAYGSTLPADGDTLIDDHESVDALEMKLFGGIK